MPQYFLLFWSQKNSSYQFGVQPSTKKFLYFSILTWSPNLSLQSFSLCLTPYSIYVPELTSTDLIFIILWHVLLYVLLLLYFFCWYWILMLANLFLQGSGKPWFLWSITKFTPLIYQFLVWFMTRLIQKFWKTLVIVIHFFVCHQNNPCISTVNIRKNLTTLLYLLINCMSARSAPQILSGQDENDLCF